MPVQRPRIFTEIRYEEAAQEYLRSLPLEHFMEATLQATQRKITVESLDLVCAQRSDVHVFNELLVQYEVTGQKKPGQVVPDNMVVLHQGPIEAGGSYNIPLQPVGPFWVLEYVSKSNRRKDYDDNFRKYEEALGVPYYMLLVPEEQELTLFRLSRKKYRSVVPNRQGRCAIPQLELEIALLGGWVRFWFQGQLLPLPADLLHERDEAREQRDEARRERDEAQQQLQAERQARALLEAKLAQLEAREKQPPGSGSE